MRLWDNPVCNLESGYSHEALEEEKDETPNYLLRSISRIVREAKSVFDEDFLEALRQATCCPLTKRSFDEPLICEDGHTYDKEAIEEWLRQSDQSPITRQVLRLRKGVINYSYMQLIEEIQAIIGCPLHPDPLPMSPVVVSQKEGPGVAFVDVTLEQLQAASKTKVMAMILGESEDLWPLCTDLDHSLMRFHSRTRSSWAVRKVRFFRAQKELDAILLSAGSLMFCVHSREMIDTVVWLVVDAYMIAKQWKECEEYLMAYNTSFPAMVSTKTLARVALLNLLQGQSERASGYLDVMIHNMEAEHPVDPCAIVVLADEMRRTGDHEGAMTLLKSVDGGKLWIEKEVKKMSRLAQKGIMIGAFNE